jgi:hypothetical protein
MTRSLLAAALAAALLATPAAAAAMPARELALAQERAYMQQAPPTTTAERALAQERTYRRTATVATAPAGPVTTPDEGAPIVLLGAIAAGVLIAAALGIAAYRRRPALVRAAS